MSEMPQVLVAGATLKCSHSGMFRLSSGSDKLVVSGNGAILSGAEVGVSFAPGAPGVTAPCTITNPGGSPTPCSIAAPAASGASTMLSVGNVPVLLSTAQGMAVNLTTGPAPWSVGDAGQQVLSVSG
jgi:hypothetical protein